MRIKGFIIMKALKNPIISINVSQKNIDTFTLTGQSIDKSRAIE